MILNITSDSHWEARLDSALNWIIDAGLQRHFATRDYGQGILQLGLVLMCQPLDYHLEQRIRFSKADATLRMDVFLDLEYMKSANPEDRIRHVLSRLNDEVPAVMRKKAIANFDLDRFEDDFREWIREVRDNLSA